MSVRLIRLLREPIIVHHLSADETFEGKGGEHIEAKAKSSDVDEDVIGREVVEDISLGEGAKGEKARESHGEARNHAYGRAVVGDEGEAIECWSAERAVDKEGIMVADKR